MKNQVQYSSPDPGLPEKIKRAITALSNLADALTESGDRDSVVVEQIAALNIESQAKPVSLPVLKQICAEVSKLLGRLEADGGL